MSAPPAGWYPELVFLAIVFLNSSNLSLMILNSSVLKICFVSKPLEKHLKDLNSPSKQAERAI